MLAPMRQVAGIKEAHARSKQSSLVQTLRMASGPAQSSRRLALGRVEPSHKAAFKETDGGLSQLPGPALRNTLLAQSLQGVIDEHIGDRHAAIGDAARHVAAPIRMVVPHKLASPLMKIRSGSNTLKIEFRRDDVGSNDRRHIGQRRRR